MTDAPIKIGGPIIVVSNPLAGGGLGLKLAGEFLRAVGDMKEDGLLIIKGDVEYLAPPADLNRRVEVVADAIARHNVARPPVVLVFAGDGTFSDVAEAARVAKKTGHHSTIVPGPGGTANDMMIELGVPRKPTRIPRFLATAAPVELDVVTARFNDTGPARIVIQSQGNGVSGAVFLEVEKRRLATGRKGIPLYVGALLRGIWNAETFFVRVNGGPEMAAGEVLTAVNSTSLGGIARTPLPRRGGRIHILPVNPVFPGVMRLVAGLPPLGDAFLKGALFMLGEQRVLNGATRIRFLDDERMIDITPDSRVTLEFCDAARRPKAVTGILNGDPVEDIERVDLAGSTDTVSALAHAGAGIMIRRRMTTPTNLSDSAMTTMERGAAVMSAGSFGLRATSTAHAFEPWLLPTTVAACHIPALMAAI